MDIKLACKKYGLDAVPLFWETPESSLRKIYNGAGPDDFNYAIQCILSYIHPELTIDAAEELLRKRITSFLNLFEPCVAIHDFDFLYSDKTKEMFNLVNNRLYSNMIRIIDKEYPLKKFWLWGQRIKWKGKAKITFLACDGFGWDAWLNN